MRSFTEREIQTARSLPIRDIWSRLGLPALPANGLVSSPWREDRHASVQVGGERNILFDHETKESDDTIGLVMRAKGCDFPEAVAFILGRKEEPQRRSKSDASSLLSPPGDQAQPNLPIRYLAHRLGLGESKVLKPSTSAVGWKELPYYDGRPQPIGSFPCAVFGTDRADGQRHALRIYVAEGGLGKAKIVGLDGRRLDAKKLAKKPEGTNIGGCAAIWGDKAAPHAVLTEGVETGQAVAHVHREEIEAGQICVMACISASGIEAWMPWPETRRVTVAADRDEAKAESDAGFKRGEQAARVFAQSHYERLEIHIALPGQPGESIDWLDVLLRDGPEAAWTGLKDGEHLTPTDDETGAESGGATQPPKTLGKTRLCRRRHCINSFPYIYSRESSSDTSERRQRLCAAIPRSSRCPCWRGSRRPLGIHE